MLDHAPGDVAGDPREDRERKRHVADGHDVQAVVPHPEEASVWRGRPAVRQVTLGCFAHQTHLGTRVQDAHHVTERVQNVSIPVQRTEAKHRVPLLTACRDWERFTGGRGVDERSRGRVEALPELKLASALVHPEFEAVEGHQERLVPWHHVKWYRDPRGRRRRQRRRGRRVSRRSAPPSREG